MNIKYIAAWLQANTETKKLMKVVVTGENTDSFSFSSNYDSQINIYKEKKNAISHSYFAKL